MPQVPAREGFGPLGEVGRMLRRYRSVRPSALR
jgi:hypothetical protein